MTSMATMSATPQAIPPAVSAVRAAWLRSWRRARRSRGMRSLRLACRRRRLQGWRTTWLAPRQGTCYPDSVAVARVTEIIASSPDGFREAVEEGVARAARTVRNITGLEVTGKRVQVGRVHVTECRVEMKLIFLLE